MSFIYFAFSIAIQILLTFFFNYYLRRLRKNEERESWNVLNEIQKASRRRFMRISFTIFLLPLPLLFLFAWLSHKAGNAYYAYPLFFIAGLALAFVSSWLSLVAFASSVKSLVWKGDYHNISGIRDAHLLNGTRVLFVLNLLTIVIALIITFMYNSPSRISVLIYGAGFTFFTILLRAHNSHLELAIPEAYRKIQERDAAIPLFDLRNPVSHAWLVSRHLSGGAAAFLDLTDSLHVIFLMTFLFGSMAELIIGTLPIAILISVVSMGYLYSARLLSRELLAKRLRRTLLISYFLISVFPMLISSIYNWIYPVFFLAGFLLRQLLYHWQLHQNKNAQNPQGSLAESSRKGIAPFLLQGMSNSVISTLVFLLPGFALLAITFLPESIQKLDDIATVMLLGFILPPIFFYTLHSVSGTLSYAREFERLNLTGKEKSMVENLSFSHRVEANPPARLQVTAYLIGIISIVLLFSKGWLDNIDPILMFAGGLGAVFFFLPFLPVQLQLAGRSSRKMSDEVHSQFLKDPQLLVGEIAPNTRRPARIINRYAYRIMLLFALAALIPVMLEIFLPGTSLSLLLASILFTLPIAQIIMQNTQQLQERKETAIIEGSGESLMGRSSAESAVDVASPLNEGLSLMAGSLIKWLALILTISYYYSRYNS